MSRVLVVCDVDSTLIENEVIELLADAAGKRGEVQRITDRAMRGKANFAKSLAQRVSTLRGLPQSVFDDVAEKITVTRGATALIDAVHDAGGLIVAVSGGFHEVLDPLATRLGLDGWTANRLELVDNVLTGRTYGPVIDGAAKASFLTKTANVRRIPIENVLMVGDGANDLEAMATAGLSVAFCAKPIVREKADIVIDDRNLAHVASLFGRRAG